MGKKGLTEKMDTRDIQGVGKGLGEALTGRVRQQLERVGCKPSAGCAQT